MKHTGISYLGLLMLLTATSGADDSTPRSANPRRVRLENCRITLIKHVTLASDRTGILSNVEFQEGDSVTHGIQVASIADEVAKATLAVAEKKATNSVDVNFAKIARDAAEQEFKRLEKANQNAEGARSVSLLELDKARLAADKARLSIEKAEHDLEVDKLDRDVKAAELKTFSVLAEFDGVVTRVFKKKGEAVRQGDPVVEIVNTDKVRIEGRVKLADLRFAKKGAKAIVRLSVEELDLPEEKEVFEGKITFVDLVSDPIDKSTRIYAEVQNRDNILRAGLMAELEIEIDDGLASNDSRSKSGAAEKDAPRTASGK
jgi:multidrug efflux pump subunit AcrA (membrane-fusion protein)